MTPPTWYTADRAAVERFFDDDPPTPDTEVTRLSPSGRYRLLVADWGETSRGRVYDGDQLISEVRWDEGPFEFAWAERHLVRHDYLLCGERHQVRTVVELDTGRRSTCVPDEAPAGDALHAVSTKPSPEGQWLAVYGCHWACPFELLVCRFGDPLASPCPEVGRAPAEGPGEWTPDGLAFDSDVHVERNPGATGPMNYRERFGGVRHVSRLWPIGGDPVVIGERYKPIAPGS